MTDAFNKDITRDEALAIMERDVESAERAVIEAAETAWRVYVLPPSLTESVRAMCEAREALRKFKAEAAEKVQP